MSKPALSLPPVVDRFVNAVNASDGEALIATFADDAFVNDECREFWGKAAIKKLTDREFIGDRVRISAREVREHHGLYVVTAEVDGNFDKTSLPSPVVFTFYFAAQNDEITTLFILLNKPAD